MFYVMIVGSWSSTIKYAGTLSAELNRGEVLLSANRTIILSWIGMLACFLLGMVFSGFFLMLLVGAGFFVMGIMTVLITRKAGLAIAKRMEIPKPRTRLD